MDVTIPVAFELLLKELDILRARVTALELDHEELNRHQQGLTMSNDVPPIPNIVNRVDTASIEELAAWARHPYVSMGPLAQQVIERLLREVEKLREQGTRTAPESPVMPLDPGQLGMTDVDHGLGDGSPTPSPAKVQQPSEGEQER